MCLKRSSQIELANKPPHINLLETLNIFGIRAQYMQQFKEYSKTKDSRPTRTDPVHPTVVKTSMARS